MKFNLEKQSPSGQGDEMIKGQQSDRKCSLWGENHIESLCLIPYTKCNSRRVKNLNEKGKTLEILEYMGDYLYNLRGFLK